MDIKTIFVCLLLSNVTMCFILLTYWKTQKTFSGFALWIFSVAFMSISYAFFALRGIIPDVLSIVIANSIALFSCSTRTDAFGRFAGKDRSILLYSSVFICFLGHLFFIFVYPDIIMRIVAISLSIIFTLSVQIELIALHYRSSRALGRILIVLNVIFIATTMIRSANWVIKSDPDLAFVDNSVNTIFFMSLIVYDSMGSIAFILMNSSRLNDELSTAHKLLEILASTDSLTGFFNRRKFFEKANNEIERYKRTKSVLSAAYIDIDGFKSINDRLGHAAGDSVLIRITDIIKRGIRGVDIAGRVGGEEFCIFFPSTNSKDSYMVMDRLRKEISETDHVFGGEIFSVTISAGISEVSEHDKSADEIISRADCLLLKAKKTGKNIILAG